MDQSDDQRYQLGELLGKGALATVVALTGPRGERYAGKLLHDSQSQDPAAVARFFQEAALLRSLGHDNLVRVIETVTVRGRPMLVMERVDGPTLAQKIARSAPLPEATILAIGRGIAEGLAHAHGAGVIHRDLKPGNVLLAGGEHPKIGDFGMARASSLAGIDHQAMTVVGTPDYMAPESLDPLAVDPRSDLYALGCILFEMASGRPPFDAATPLGLLHQHRSAPIPPPPEGLSPSLRRLIERLLAKSPGDRPQSAETVALRLEEIAAGDDPKALALVSDERGAATCTACGQRLLVEVGLCLACGQPTATLGEGDFAVLITGPGNVGDKIDTQLRDRLCAWIAGNPGLHLDAAPLAKKIPRLPFPLCAGVDEAGAAAVVRGLAQIGAEAIAHRGHVLREPSMRKKSSTLMFRTMAIIAATGGYWAVKAYFFLPIVLVGAAVVSIVGATRRTTRALPRGSRALAPAISEALGRVERVVPGLAARRHRMALRAVVHRALALAEGSPKAATGDELGQAIDAALVAAGRLDALDRELEQVDIRNASDEVRARLHERDVWSARLLEMTASLDAIQARAASARERIAGDAAEARLADLRARIEALEEVAAVTEGSGA